MAKLLAIMSTINSNLCKVLINIMATILAAISIILFVSVFMRYVVNNPVTWTEDAVNFLMVWMVLFGTSVGLREGYHISIEFIQQKVTKQLRILIHILTTLIIIFVAWIILKHGIAFSMKGMRRIIPSIEWLKFGYAYFALPIGYGLMLLISIEHILQDVYELVSLRKSAHNDSSNQENTKLNNQANNDRSNQACNSLNNQDNNELNNQGNLEANNQAKQSPKARNSEKSKKDLEAK